MATFVVLEPPAGTADEAAERAAFLRDGFTLPAFVFAPVWLLWHRLWIEALAVVAAMLVISTLAELAGLGVAGSLASLLLSLFVGLEATNLRSAALRRRGWRDWGVVEGDTLDDAETRYAMALGDESVPDDLRVIEPARSAIPLPHLPARGTPVFGLLDYPSGS